ncbi:RagB/SusD family nutrient uptake outer membrane protein [Hymenobacter sp. NBH84]|uniref:RagB/SusD family nutrient uptake outer membrane protein n=1 Tax=Hymenobacter sp. NBH84 TaxID=2596915 RepID=UPI001623F88E|nr:RagB/SusD family nutrient uptake outer membrane protein [Hymenobacter sp. NBH84]QNE38109.1 RagB/SusD family nutrient uptake outer membrane protein [Hymenobacter sp. NBH84]
MKNSIKNAATVALGALFLAAGATSCKDELLDPLPQTQFVSEVVFNTPTRISLQVNNLYAYIKAGGFYGGRYIVYGDVRANDFINQTTNSVTAFQVWNHTLTETSSNDVVSLWNAAYAAINQINVFLAGLEANTAKYIAPTFPADFATTTVVQYQAEARLLRALSYYSMLQLYARPYIDGEGSKPGLPLRLQAETGQGNNDLARSTVAEVYAQIIADLNFAEENLPLTYGNAALNVTRAHRNTAIALKTRVYLTMGQYGNVITEANKIVSTTSPFTAASGVNHALNPSIVTVFAPPQTTTESILSFPFTAQNAPGTQNQLGFYFNREFSLNPDGIVGNTTAWPATDARRVNFVTTSNNLPYLGKKYPTGSPYTDNAPVIRYAEVLLNLAEARVRTTTAGASDPQALALLNAIRTRSSSPAYAQATVENILQERRIEFLGEGIRNIDIMRLNATIPAKGTVKAIAPSDRIYVWPIPQTETLTNGLITPN